MPDSSPSPASEGSHESDLDEEHQAQSSKLPATKDKECPYCRQAFTSSSLGRHLDQFLSKKKPDGIHNVDEIRRLRGGITRRTPRNSKRDHRDSESTKPSPAAPAHQNLDPQNQVIVDELNAVPPGGIGGRINSLNWQTTGVITDPSVLNTHLPPNTPTNRSASPTTNLKKRNFTTFANDLQPGISLSETTRALELSLREVLDALRAATKHASVPPSPFDFDLHSQTFPSLILHLLPTPPTLYQSSPFSTLTTTPISAPGPDQLRPLQTQISHKIDSWKWQALRLAQRTTTNIADEADFLGRQADAYTNAACTHLNTAYENWMAHPSEVRDLLWHVELLRAFQSQKDKVSDLEDRMDELQQEANHLQQQVEYLSSCQWPREMALWPPERHAFSRKMADEVRLINVQKPIPGGSSSSNAPPANGEAGKDHGNGNGNGDDDDDGIDPNVKVENINVNKDKWDFDKLVNKWRAHIKEDRQRRTPYIQSTGGTYGHPTYPPSSTTTTTVPGGSSNAASGAAGGMHWLGERGRYETTTTPLSTEPRRGDINGNGMDTDKRSPLVVGPDGNRTRSADQLAHSGHAYAPHGVSIPNVMGPRKNISIISDIGGD